MPSPQLVEWRREALATACATLQSPQDVLETASDRLRRLVPFDGSAWFGADPTTLLATTPARIENIEPGHCVSFWEREFLVEDSLLFRDLARAAAPADTLLRATDDHPARSSRYREFLAPQGYGDELRAVLRVGSSVWGLLNLYRDRGRPAFCQRDVDTVAAVGPIIGEALRNATRVRAAIDLGGDDSPGLLIFDGCGKLLSMNDAAQRWLDQIDGTYRLDGADAFGLASPVVTALARARSIAAGHDRGPARLRLQSRTGRWLVIHASCLRGLDGALGNTAVVVEPAKSAEIAPIIVTAYGLTPREQEITRAVARGLANNEVAEALHLSVHTVRDYLKVIFDKLGVSSRGELVAKLFGDHYGPELHLDYVHLER
jgi:DNA-binding NarL/FixJ family response regulator